MEKTPRYLVIAAALSLLVALACTSGGSRSEADATLEVATVQPASPSPAPEATRPPSPTTPPSPTPTATPVPDPTSTPTAAPVPDPTPTATPVPDTTPTPTAAPVQESTPTPTATPVPDTTPTPTATASPLGATDRTDAQLRATRGLPAPADLTRDLQTREDLRSQTESEIEELLTEDILESIRLGEVALKLLGLIPPDASIIDIFTNLLSEGIAGYFDPEEDTLFIIKSDTNAGLSFEDEFTYAHEYVHALQHGTFDLVALLDEVEDDTDRSAAYDALVEGDATLTSIIWALNNRSAELDALIASDDDDGGALDDFPEYIVRDFTFPYREGVDFVGTLYVEGDRTFRVIDEAYENPPSTTEQILHPEKYFEGETGKDVSLPPLAGVLGPGWESSTSTTRGEFDLRLWVEVISGEEDSETAAAAAAGWDGDVMEIFAHDDGRAAVAGLIMWDNGFLDFVEFFGELVTVYDSSAAFASVDEDPLHPIFEGEVGFFSVGLAKDGESSVYAAANDLADVRLLMAEIAFALPD